MAKNNDIDPGAVNLIAKSTKVNGDINSDNDIRIDGELEGNLVTTGRLIVGQKGKIKGNITCKLAEIEGVLCGKASISELFTLKASANFNGEVETNQILIEPGAIFTGTCKMSGEKANKNK